MVEFYFGRMEYSSPNFIYYILLMKLVSSTLAVLMLVNLNINQKCNKDAGDNKSVNASSNQITLQDSVQQESKSIQKSVNIADPTSRSENKKKNGKEEITGWLAPDWADTLQNPFANDLTATEKGKNIFDKMCSICHGEKGDGDGVAGINLNPRPADYSTERVQNQSNGAIYWKITEGNPPMASYKQTLSDEQRWQLVNYVRELGKK